MFVLTAMKSNVLRRSVIKSSASSNPMESLIRLSFTPAALRMSSGMVLWVIWAEWLIRLLMPPRLSASLKTPVLVTNFVAAARVSSFSEKETMPQSPGTAFWIFRDSDVWGVRDRIPGLLPADPEGIRQSAAHSSNAVSCVVKGFPFPG